jgi:hypothetical protein
MFRQIVAALAIDLGLLGVCLARGILVDDYLQGRGANFIQYFSDI